MWTHSWHRIEKGDLLDKVDNTGYLRFLTCLTREELLHRHIHLTRLSFSDIHLFKSWMNTFFEGKIIENVTFATPSIKFSDCHLSRQSASDLSVWPHAFGMEWWKVLQHSSTPPLFIRQWPCDLPSQASVSRWQERSREATRCSFSSLKMIGFLSGTKCKVFIVTCI